MSCEACSKAQTEGDAVYFIRWKTANIMLVGCPEHIKEVMDAIRNAGPGK